MEEETKSTKEITEVDSPNANEEDVEMPRLYINDNEKDMEFVRNTSTS